MQTYLHTFYVIALNNMKVTSAFPAALTDIKPIFKKGSETSK